MTFEVVVSSTIMTKRINFKTVEYRDTYKYLARYKLNLGDYPISATYNLQQTTISPLFQK